MSKIMWLIFIHANGFYHFLVSNVDMYEAVGKDRGKTQTPDSLAKKHTWDR